MLLRSKLHYKLIAVLAITVLIPIIGITFSSLKILTQRLEARLTDKANNSVRLVASVVADSKEALLSYGRILAADLGLQVDLSLGNDGLVKALLAAKKALYQVDSLVVTDENGRVVAQVDSAHEKGADLSQDRFYTHARSTVQPWVSIESEDGQLVIQVAYPIMMKDGTWLGLLKMVRLIDPPLLGEIKETSGADISILVGTDLHLTTLSAGTVQGLGDRLTKNESFVTKAVPMYSGEGNPIGTWVVSISRAPTQAAKSQITGAIFAVSIVAMILACIVGAVFAMRITIPVRALVRATKKIAGADLDQRVEVTTSDEVGELASEFNHMAEALQKTTVSKRYVDSIMHSMLDILIVMTPHGKLETVNDAGSKLLGYKAAELVGQPLEMLFEKDENPRTQWFETLREKGFLINTEITCRTKDGKHIPVLLSGSIMYDAGGLIQGVVCVLKDITERKQAEVKIKDAYTRLEGLLAFKDELINRVNHELRTPLTSIKEGVNLFLENVLGDTTKEQRKFLKVINQNVDRLTALVRNMLDVSKAESGQMQLKCRRLDLSEFVRSLSKHYKPLAEDRNLSTELADVPPVFADPDLLRQVLDNLFSNAVKFTEKNGSIVLGVRRKGAEVTLTVTDDGRGITPEDLPKLFQKFSQVGERDPNQPGGTGLGLAVCMDIVQLHKGRIEATSEPGKGSTFTVFLPVYQDASALTEGSEDARERKAS